jgi:hypothetical protein
MNYIIKVFSFSILLLALVALINWFTDPYGMQWSPSLEGVNAQKTEAENRGRLIKPLRVAEVTPEILLVGNSRVEIGIPAESEAFAGKSVYNLGLPGVTIDIQLRNANTQLKTNPHLQRLILTLDFRNFLFNYSKIQNLDDLAQHYAPQDSNFEDKVTFYSSILFSLDSLNSGVKTLFKQGSLNNDISFAGTNSAGTYQAVIKNEGLNVLVGHQLSELHKKLLRSHVSYQGKAFQQNYGIELLDTFLTEHSDNQVRISLMINPYHYSYLHVLKETGHWQNFLNWKEELALLADKHKRIEFYDFSLFNQYTTEIMNLNTPRKPMNWFWEPAHYRPEYGDMILNAMDNNISNYPLALRLSSDTLPKIINNNQNGIKNTMSDWTELKTKGLKLKAE